MASVPAQHQSGPAADLAPGDEDRFDASARRGPHERPEVEQRRRLRVELARRGIVDERVLDAFESVRREAFVPGSLAYAAYDDRPLPIGEGQTISQPLMVAIMLEALELRPEDRVLEVGTGSGYAAALAAHLACEVFTVERLPRLAADAARRLAHHGYDAVHVRPGDGTLGWPEAGPFDAILVSAGGPHIPGQLLDQLGDGGRLVMPVGRNERSQRLVRVRRRPGRRWSHEDLGAVRFVPLIGVGGWPAEARDRGELLGERPPR
jgi:protein-L-isoaspartate(D-aspartate) O-methyltransferase